MAPRKCSRNKKADRGIHEDQINDLPSNVIDIILTKLPIKDLVRTSILSKKWRYIWNSVPRLEFDHSSFENYELPYDPNITDIINEVLLQHNGPIHKFILDIPTDYTMRIGCLSKWVLFLSRRGVKEIQLANYRMGRYQMPPHIFSCDDLKMLHLEYFELKVPPSFHGFKSLTGLHLFEVIVESCALENLIFNCPCLYGLTLYCCSCFECLNVSSPCLQVLYIEGRTALKSICLKNAKIVNDLSLLNDIHMNDFDIYDLIEGLPKLKKLCLVANNIKILSTGSFPQTKKSSTSSLKVPQTMKSSIDSLKYLELQQVHFDETKEILVIICLLKSLPNLVKLIVKGDGGASEPRASHFNELECSNHCLGKLKTVDIDVKTANKNSLTLIRFVLANASSLETLKFNVGLGLPQSHALKLLLSVTEDLLQMERASQRAKVKFLHG